MKRSEFTRILSSTAIAISGIAGLSGFRVAHAVPVSGLFAEEAPRQTITTHQLTSELGEAGFSPISQAFAPVIPEPQTLAAPAMIGAGLLLRRRPRAA